MIPVNTPLLNGNEKKYLTQCIDTGWISSEGPFVKQFEDAFSKQVKRKYGIAMSSGTSALEAAVLALGIGKNDEVILPTFSIISCSAAIAKAGAKPILVDSDPETWNMDVNQIEQKITKNTKAIMIVHTYGLPADVNPIIEIARKFNLKVIEDAAEMHGQYYYDKPCGNFGDISVFSFYPNKHITTGEGGMVVTDNVDLASECRLIRNLYFDPKKRFVHHKLGSNFRMTNIQAAIGLAQLEQLDNFIQRKRQIGELYLSLLSDIKYIQLPLPETKYAKNIFWVFGIVLEKSKINAEYIMNKLKNYNIGSRPFFYPTHLQPVFLKMNWYNSEKYPVSENLAEKGFYIPSGLALTNDEIQEVSNVLHEILI